MGWEKEKGKKKCQAASNSSLVSDASWLQLKVLGTTHYTLIEGEVRFFEFGPCNIVTNGYYITYVHVTSDKFFTTSI
jgi:hypothetical protein